MLTDVRCRGAKKADKAYQLGDTLGLYLMVLPSGVRSWRMKYYFGKKEKRLTFGQYPEVSLAEARARRDEARRLVREGIDPDVDRKQQAANRITEGGNTLQSVVLRWHDQQKPHWTPRYAGQVLQRFENDVFPAIGKLPVTQVTVALVLGMLRTIQARGAKEGAHRVRQHLADAFAMAISEGIATTNPAFGLGKALLKVSKGRRPAILQVAAARILISKVEAEPVYASTKLGSRLLALTAARPGVVRLAAPEEFEQLDGPEPIWRVPAAKMKLTAAQKRDVTYEFIVPLSRQAVEVVKVALERYANPKVLFPNLSGKPLSDSTLSSVYRDAGYAGRHVPHGWRSTFSTTMNALAAIENRVGDREVIDLMLAHMAAGVEPIYNRYAYLPRRREIAQEWADMLLGGLPRAATLFYEERGTSDRNLRRRDVMARRTA
jgi:hypothetical protein